MITGFRPTVLAVDDDGSNLRILTSILEAVDCRLLLAKSGEKALELVKTQHPDLILLDVIMPGLDGFEVCQQVKADPDSAEALVIFLSALDDADSRVKGFEMGGVDYIPKPFHPVEVLTKVRTHLRTLSLNKTLVAQNEELGALNRRQNQLLGMAAHDLRTPLTTIYGAVHLLAEMEFPPMHKELLEMVKLSSANMRRIIDEILDISTLQASEVSLRPEKVSPRKLLDQHIALQRAAAESKRIQLELEAAEIPECWMDTVKIGQVFDNLLSNAIKYSHPESSIQAKLYLEGDEVRFSVSDQGVGIPEQGLSKVFEPFVKVGRRPTAGESSTGLGLAIVKNIVESHGGKVSAISQIDQGSTFTVSWPFRTSPPVSMGVGAETA